MKDEVVILSGTRTPIGNLCGVFNSLKAHDLGSHVIKASIAQANLQPSDVTEVILGQALTAGQGQNPARQAAIAAGLPQTVPAYLVNLLCGSGILAVGLGYQTILADPNAVVVAGGQESMTQAPHARHLRNPNKLGNVEFVDTMLMDGLTDAFHNIHMGNTAENIAVQKNISRHQQDTIALLSQTRTKKAVEDGLFRKEITPVTIKEKSKTVVIETDEYPRPNTTMESLSLLKPVFVKDGTVTAGNTSGINDGAAALVLMSASNAAAKKLKPRARIVGYAKAGIDPLVMGLGPILAVQNLFKQINWTKDDVDLFELNEAYAVQHLAVMQELGIDPAKVNINGGALSLGHPLGASGARILVTLLHALELKNVKRGVAALCIGGGMGIAMAIEIC